MRIYVGGLGSSVQEDDLRKTFTSPQLGTVESVEIIRSKGRSFGYLGFTPASDKGLAKLFSTYNGCMWKGGRLKLEKAKEDYLSRLRREWEEEAELNNMPSSKDADKDESVPTLEKPQKLPDIEKMQLKLFFPKLRKLKPIPLKGTGKHKYSFQRVEVPPLPIHFCDCEEHSGPLLAKRNGTDVHETNDHRINVQGAGIYEVNENELNMMKTILDKFLEKENTSEKVDNEMEEEVSDEDDLLINVKKKSRTKVDPFDWGYKTTSVKNQDSLHTETKSFGEPIHENSKNKNARLLSDKKRKLPIQNDEKDQKAAKKVRHDSGDDPVITNVQSSQMGSDSIELSRDVTSSRKSAGRNLIREKESHVFHISDILMARNPEPEAKPGSNDPTDDFNVSGKDEQSDKSSEGEESEKTTDVESTKPSASNDKIARGAAWLHKSSWLQLVADANNNAFNIGQILPGVTFEKQEPQQNEISNLRSEERVANAYMRDPVGDIGESKANRNLRNLTEEPNRVDGHEEQSSSQGNLSVESDEASALMHGSNSVVNYRAIGDVIISETCPFMRSSASMKEWAKTKAALSGSHKKKGKGNTSVDD